MSEAAETLARQLKEWEAKAESARETLRIAKGILPALRLALSEIGEGISSDSTKGAFEALVAESMKSDEDDQSRASAESDDDEEDELTQFRSAEDVQAAVIGILDGLPQQFEQRDVQDALNEATIRVNRSTLRQNLLMLAKAKEGFRVLTPGKGRKATVFEKVDDDVPF